MSYPPPTPGYSPHPPQADQTPPKRGKVHPLTWTALVVVLLGIGGVGWLLYQRATTPTVSINGEPADIEAAADMPTCKELYQPGKVIDEKKALAGCMGPRNVISAGSFFNCADGSALFSVDADSGAPAGWGFGGKKFHAAKEPAADPAYGKAYTACNG
jgi:hypothetical protein